MSRAFSVAIAADQGYAHALLVCVASAASQLPLTTLLDVHILDGGLSQRVWRQLHSLLDRLHPHHRLTGHRLDLTPLQDFADRGGLGRLCYARLMLGDLIQAKRVLYLDADTLCLSDPSPLHDHPLNGTVLGAVQDVLIPTLGQDLGPLGLPAAEQQQPYFNSGVLVIDLDRWRDLDIGRCCFELLHQQGARCQYHDQTALNWVLRGHWTQLPAVWNACAGDSHQASQALILHFYGCMKPWVDAQAGTWTHDLWHRTALRQAHLLPFVHLNRLVSKQRLCHALGWRAQR
jgi:lipopolysaccharide biosynthesis glycosyltransferase